MPPPPPNEEELVGKLIERLMTDPQFRAEFRRNPAQACNEAGLPELGSELGGSGKAMHTMEMRESRSSLAGVVMAVAVEGMSITEAEHLMHGASGLGKGLHGLRLPRSVAGLKRGLSPEALERRVERKAGLSGHGVSGLERSAERSERSVGSGSSGSSSAAGSSSSSGSVSGSSAPGSGSAAGSGSGVAASSVTSGGGASSAASSSVSAAGSGSGSGGVSSVSGSWGGSSAVASASSGAASAAASAPAGGGSGSVASAASAGSVGSGSGSAPVLPWPDEAPAGGAGGGVGAAVSSVPAGGAGGSGAAAAVSSVPSGGVGGSGAAAAVSSVPAGGSGSGSVAAEAVSSAPAGGSGGSGVAGVVSSVPGAGGAGAAVDGVASSGVAPVGLSGLLSSSNLSVTPAVRSWLEGGGVDPRAVGVLDQAVGHYQLGLGSVVVSSSPVHVQQLVITSVNGQPVGPDNFAARDLVTEIAAMDPSVRPDEIGTPWPIESQGFFSDGSSVSSLRLAFELPGTNAGAGEVAGYAGQVPGGGGVPQMQYAIGAQPTVGAAGGVPVDPSYGTAGTAGGVPVDPSYGTAGTAPVDPSSVGVAGVPAQAVQPDLAVGVPAASVDPAAAPVDPSMAAGAGAPVAGTAPVDPSTVAGSGTSAAGTSTAGGVVDQVASSTTAGGGGTSTAAAAEARLLAYTHDMVGKLTENLGANLGTNLNRFEGEFGYHGQAWCGIFAGHALEAAGLQPPHSVASVASILSLAQNGDHPFVKGILPISEARVGDLATFGGAEHVAIITKIDSAGIHTISGNSANQVEEVTYPPSAVTGVVRPDYAHAAPVSQLSAWDKRLAGGIFNDPSSASAGTTPVQPDVVSGSNVPATAGATPGAAAASAVPPVPGTQQFQALPGGGHEIHRATVKFLQAIPQPTAAASSAAGASGAVEQAAEVQGASGAAAAAGTAQPAVEQVIGSSGQAQPVVEQVGTSGQVVDRLSQGSGALASGASFTVSSPILTSGQSIFAAHLAQLTGLSPRVIAAWELAEESGSFAQGRQAANNYNWLNIGYFDSGAGAMAFDHAFSDPVTAAEQTAKFLKGTWGGASASIQAILHSVGQSDQQQISAIANSDWASTHYYGGSSLRGTFAELDDMKIIPSGPTD